MAAVKMPNSRLQKNESTNQWVTSHHLVKVNIHTGVLPMVAVSTTGSMVWEHLRCLPSVTWRLRSGTSHEFRRVLSNGSHEFESARFCTWVWVEQSMVGAEVCFGLLLFDLVPFFCYPAIKAPAGFMTACRPAFVLYRGRMRPNKSSNDLLQWTSSLV